MKKVKKKAYEKELLKLQTRLVELQEWIKQEGLKVVVVEGRDAAADEMFAHTSSKLVIVPEKFQVT